MKNSTSNIIIIKLWNWLRMYNDASRSVILLHPNVEALATPIPFLLTRLNKYGEMLQFETGNKKNKLIIALGISKPLFQLIDKKDFPSIHLLRLSGRKYVPIYFSFKSFLIIQKQIRLTTKCTVIAGDLRAALLPTVGAKILFRHRVRTQISIHGAVFYSQNPVTIRKFATDLLIRLMIRLTIRLTDSVRVVSKHLEVEIRSKYKSSQGKTFVAPIPILESSFNKEYFRKVEESIVVLGRLHSERGVLEIIHWLANFLILNPRIQLTIAGEGPLKPNIEEWVSKLGLPNQVSVVGNLPSREVNRLLSRSHILVSNAPHEGYGLAIREAALHGCLIVARRNKGTEELIEVFGNRIFLYETIEEFQSNLELALQTQADLLSTSHLISTQKSIDSAAKRNLIWSWLVD